MTSHLKKLLVAALLASGLAASLPTAEPAVASNGCYEHRGCIHRGPYWWYHGHPHWWSHRYRGY